ncbi:MAG: serine protease, partial [Planctomycetes bacterium]|nr:serine protease [Planctomycetota bacterium]
CRDRLDDSHSATDNVEDELLKNTLIAQAITLMDQGQTVDLQVLIPQLNRKSCVLDLFHGQPVDHDPVSLYQSGTDSVVVVAGVYRCGNCSRWHSSIASGFVISTSGAIVTNYHVVDSPDRQTLVVMTSDRRVFPVQRVLAASRENDLAILQIEADNLKPLAIAETAAESPVGSAVSVISHPDGRFYFLTDGIISRRMTVRSAGHVIDAVAITADYARGSSGAPVLNRNGKVVAVVSSTESIYYTQDGARQRDLQMVFKNCIPATSLLRLVDSIPQVTENAAGLQRNSG